ncbi:type II secretion system protein GspL [Vreelandella utahensis]|uniref:type II secretion system protein GspL n=1 Tax=Vreelandella halophila TaxID=86177 RepID=UPI0009856D84|nr:type II secretion system protein GspL [Halomonas utahensis]
MAYQLYIRAGAEAGEGSDADGFDWVLLDASGNLGGEGQGDSRENLETRLEAIGVEAAEVIGIIPTLDVTPCSARIPGRQKRMIRQALPFAVEEQLAQDIDSVHLALGTQTRNEWQVAAIDRERMDAYAAWFDTFGYPVRAIHADAMLLPAVQHHWTILVEESQALIQEHGSGWYQVPVEGLSVFLDSLIESYGAETPQGARVLATPHAAEQHRMALASLEQHPDALIHVETLEQPPLRLMVESLVGGNAEAVDLCQGDYAPASSGHSPLRRWRPVAIVAAIGIAAQLGFMVAEGVYYRNQAQRFNEQAVAIYREYFPDESRTDADNLRRVTKGKIRAARDGGSGGDFLAMLRATGQQYQGLDDPQSLRFDTIQFSRSRGELRIELRGESFAQLDAMRNGLSSSGFSARIGSVVNSDDGTEARLTVRQGG